MGARPDKTATAALEFGLVVRDMKLALSFYRDLLGAEPAGEVILPSVHMYRLRFGNSILKLNAETITPGTGNPTGPATGFRFLGLRVDNLVEIVEACEQAGVVFRPAADGGPPPSRIVSYNGVAVAAVLDPEGNEVELVQGSIWGDAEA